MTAEDFLDDNSVTSNGNDDDDSKDGNYFWKNYSIQKNQIATIYLDLTTMMNLSLVSPKI